MSTSAALTLEQGAAHLAAIVGAEHAIVRGETVVAVPADVRQVAEVLRFANANGLTVMPSGRRHEAWLGEPGCAGHRVEPEAYLPTSRACLAGHDLHR